MDNWKTWRNNLQKKFKTHPLEIIQWEITRRCDLQCQHCGSPKEGVNLENELTAEEAINVFKQIKNEFDLSNFKFITLTGGEPFIRKDIWDILSLFKSFGWVTTIQTNGNYLSNNPEKIFNLYELGVKGIGLDLDGLTEYHDNLRRKDGHWNQIINLLQKILHFSKSNNDFLVTVTTVVTKKNINSLPDLWEIIKNINPHRWRLLPIEGVGRAKNDLILEKEDYVKLLNFIKEKRLENIDVSGSVQIELGCIGWFGKELEGRIRPYVWSCIAGHTVLGILYDGSLGACAHIDRAFIQGNVREDNILDVWENRYKIFRKRPEQSICKDCTEKNFCTMPMHKLDSSGKIRECVYGLTKGGGKNE